MLRSLLEEKILAVEQWKDDTRRLNKRYPMEMNVLMAHMFHVATQQALLPAEQRTATPESICQNPSVEFGKFDTKPYIETMKSKIEISYPTDITDIIKARKASTRVQTSSSSVQAEPKSITPDLALKPIIVPATKAAPSNLALGK